MAVVAVMDVMAVVAVPEISPLFHDMALGRHAGITAYCTIPILIASSVEASVLILGQLIWGTGNVSHAVPSFATLEHQDPLHIFHGRRWTTSSRSRDSEIISEMRSLGL